MMNKYTVVESKVWKHTSGRTASIYCCPWTRESERKHWTIVSRGWTIRNNAQNTVGYGQPPLESRNEADALCLKWNSR